MTFLSHSIPWLSLSRLFEYRGAKSGPGPQEAHLHTEEAPAHRKQLEHFGINFQKTVREHSLIERGRYNTPQAYRDRAATWTASVLVDELPGQGRDAQNSTARHESRKSNGCVATLANARKKTASIETRRVYPAYFTDTYMSLVPPTSGGAYGRRGLLASLADISAWVDYYKRYNRYWAGVNSDSDNRDEETYNTLWLDVKSCSDILRLLVIDAATTSDEVQRRERLSTLLLLANHPEVGLEGFLSDGMACCNMSSGFSRLVEKTVPVFIFLNLLLASAEDDSETEKLMLRPSNDLLEYQWTRGRKPLEHLLPRPAYMNMRSYFRILEQALDEHGHAVEHVLFNPLFAPRPSGRCSSHLTPEGESAAAGEAKLERDVMSDRQSLHDALKQMWKVLVFCDVVFREAGETINWEYVSLNAIDELFLGETGKLVGREYWCQYLDERDEESSFTFYADSGKG